MPDKEEQTFWQKAWKKAGPPALLLILIGGIADSGVKEAGKPLFHWAGETADTARDYFCGGKPAMAEGDRLSTQAERDLKGAQALLGEANRYYRTAYDCGYPDAGLRLAISHCLGLGAPKEPNKAFQIVLEVEKKYPERSARAKDLRKACGFPL